MKKIRPILILVIFTICIVFNQTVYAAIPLDSDNISQYLLKIINMVSDRYQGDVDGQRLIESAVGGMYQSVDSQSTYSSSDYKDLQYLKKSIDTINNKYNGNISSSKLINGALNGIFNSFDSITCYYSSEEYSDLFNKGVNKGGYVGITITKKDNNLEVENVASGSPADNAGIILGDRIISIDNKNLNIVNLTEATNLLRGVVGSKVILGIQRDGIKEFKNIELVRTNFNEDPISYEIINNIAYIRLSIFTSNSSEEMSKILEEIDNKGIQKVILDLRNNQGGEVEQITKIAEKFVPEGLITKLDFKSASAVDEQYYSHLNKTNYKLVVIVNGKSASGAEILAGAIQDTKAGILVGTKTYGTAKIQNVIPILTPEASENYSEKVGEKLVDGFDLVKQGILPMQTDIIGYAKITTGEFYTPKGRMIENIGLTPDVEIEGSEIFKDIDIFNIQRLKKINKLGLNYESTDVYNAKRILKLAGYDVDISNMKLDDKTSNAIAKFQKEHGGYPSGELDFTTQQWLNDKFDQLIPELDRQYQKAVEILQK